MHSSDIAASISVSKGVVDRFFIACSAEEIEFVDDSFVENCLRCGLILTGEKFIGECLGAV